MINHLHGSTGICGVAYYQAPQFPAEYQECLYLCNPVNGQVHRDKLDVHARRCWRTLSPTSSRVMMAVPPGRCKAGAGWSAVCGGLLQRSDRAL